MRSVSLLSLSLSLLSSCSLVSCFSPFVTKSESAMKLKMAADAPTMKGSEAEAVYDPSERDTQYQGNLAQYLIDLHDAKGTFDFCGGMMFQLVLTDKLREYLHSVASGDGDSATLRQGQGQGQPVLFDSSKRRMSMVPNYSQTSAADNVRIFHGREIRLVPNAAGGMGMVLQLSLAADENVNNENMNTVIDPEGWTKQEIERYDGWGHDSGREWRKGPQLLKEGFTTFQDRFGPRAFSLHHRFYLHLDQANRLWLSAEDGCEGTPSGGGSAGGGGLGSMFSNMFGL